MLVSIIIPIFNEEENIASLVDNISEALKRQAFTYEVLFINDGSTDSSGQILEQLADTNKQLKLIQLRRNYGQTAAIMAGFDFASGHIIVPMDADLQNDPRDIPKLVEKIKEGYDVCSGWRKERKDSLLKRKLPSWIANRLISRFCGVRLHDYGCSLKAYKREIIKDIKLYGEMHRFIPVYAKWIGASITEIPVNHFSRKSGRSKYGMERTFKVLLDLLFIMFFTILSSKPIYIFGGFGVFSGFLSILCFFLMIYYKFWGNKSFVETPLPQLAVLFFLVGFISVLMGFLAELLVRTYYESQGKPVYMIKKLSNLENES
jgi:glycosyltransferase involved in cell wall biosynthesis